MRVSLDSTQEQTVEWPTTDFLTHDACRVGDKLVNRKLFGSGDFLERAHECRFEADARMVPVELYRSFADSRSSPRAPGLFVH